MIFLMFFTLSPRPRPAVSASAGMVTTLLSFILPPSPQCRKPYFALCRSDPYAACILVLRAGLPGKDRGKRHLT